MKNIKTEYLPQYTYEDYVQWEGSWELINGIPYAMTPAPDISHQDISQKIAAHLEELFKDCEKYKPSLPVDWKIDDNTVLQPDNLVIPRGASGKFLSETPDIIFEIISPSSAYKDRNIKYKIYESRGVRYYIIIDPVAKVAEVFALKSKVYKKETDAQDDIYIFKLDECDVDFQFEKLWR